MVKAILIIYSESLDGQLLEILSGLGVTRYSKFPEVLGLGGHSEPHLNDNIWPGANCGLLIATDEENKMKLLEKLRLFKNENIKEGFKVFVLPVEEVI
jgi:hypothetical protein